MILINLTQNKISSNPTAKELINSIINGEKVIILDNIKKRIKKSVYNSNKTTQWQKNKKLSISN